MNVPMTTGQVAEHLGKPVHRVQYAVRTRRIEPSIVAGRNRLFGPAEVEKIARAIRDAESHNAPIVAQING